MAVILLSASGCDRAASFYLTGSLAQNQEIRELFRLLEQEKEEGEKRFVIMQQISNRMMSLGELDELILFLTVYVERNPEDPYNAHYLMIVADTYRKQEAVPMAVHYYHRILANYPDLLVAGNSIHYRCLQELLSLVPDPTTKIEVYKELVARFSDAIDLGVTYYGLARAYEDQGQWEQAMQVYQQFLQYPEAEIPGVPDAHTKVKQKVDFFYSGKEWTVESLGQLVTAIRQAIATRNAAALLKYKAKVNFFTLSWSQAKSEETASMVFDIGAFLHTSYVVADANLDIDSNAGEAFLRTTSWSYRIPTWYLYFRKVDFKPDPEVNGRWEWAGIYFGEKL